MTLFSTFGRPVEMCEVRLATKELSAVLSTELSSRCKIDAPKLVPNRSLDFWWRLDP